MDKVYDCLPLPNDIRKHIRQINKDAAVADLLSILVYTAQISFPKRKQMFDDLVKDQDLAEQLAVRSCCGAGWKVEDDMLTAEESRFCLLNDVVMTIGSRKITTHFAAGKKITHERYENHEDEAEQIKQAKNYRDLLAKSFNMNSDSFVYS